MEVTDPLDALAAEHGGTAAASQATDPLDALAGEHGGLPVYRSTNEKDAAGDPVVSDLEDSASRAFGLGPAIGATIGSFTPAGWAGSAIGGAAGEGYQQIAQHYKDILPAIADVVANLRTHPLAVAQGAMAGAKKGALDAGLAGAGAGALGAIGSATVDAFPRVGRASQTFERVMSQAKNVPVDVTAPGNVALRIQELADRGGSMPMVVRKFLARVTDPAKAPLTYGEARDFASNVSRLSATEYGRLTPVVAREVGNLRVALNDAVAKAAGKAGMAEDYASAMKEYAQAMRVRSALNAAVEGAKRGVPYATLAGAAGWASSRLAKLLAN